MKKFYLNLFFFGEQVSVVFLEQFIYFLIEHTSSHLLKTLMHAGVMIGNMNHKLQRIKENLLYYLCGLDKWTSSICQPWCSSYIFVHWS